MTAPTGLLVETLVPGSPDWLKKMSASKVAAVLGLSVWDSPFSMWHKMNGSIVEPDDDLKRRGHYLEPAIVAWFADQHPDWQVRSAGTWQHPVDTWATASPDRLLVKPGNDRALLECKSDADGTGWGDPGTSTVPPGVEAQCRWQLYVTGLTVCHVAIIGPFLEFQQYVVHRDAAYEASMRQRAREFLDTLEAGQRPDIDGHSATYSAVRNLHPDIEPDTAELERDLAVEFCQSRAALKAAKSRDQQATSAVADYMGNAQRATYGGQTIARRQAKSEGIPYLVAGRNLPAFSDSEAVAS